mgnify:CR=1 FL=1
MTDLEKAARAALEFCEFAWRDVPMNEYAFEQLEQTITALRQALEQQPAERLELIGHADLNINNIYIFNGYGEEVPEGRTPIYAGYKEQPCSKQN